MAYLQPRVPDPNRILDFSLVDFTGGLNNRGNILQVNESPEILNMSFSPDTFMEKRNGQRAYNGMNFGAPVTHIGVFSKFEAQEGEISIWGTMKWGDKYNKDGNFIVASTDEKIYVENVEVGEVKGQVTGFTHQGKYFFVDGDKLYVYGEFAKVSATFSKVIGDVPETDVMLEVVSPPEDYTPLDRNEDKTTEIDREDEGKVQRDKDNAIAYLEGVTVVDYEKKQIWYEPCLMEMKDHYKGANVVPKKLSCLVSHHNRLFVSGSSEDNDNVFISDIASPYYFPVGLPMQLLPNADRIVGMTVYDDSIVVGRRHDIYVITGLTNRLDAGQELFQLRKLNTHTGFTNNFSFNHVHNHLFFFGNDGQMYALGSTRTGERQLSTEVISDKLSLGRTPINVSESDYPNVRTIFHDDHWYVSVGDKVLVYSYRHKAWTLYDGMNVSSFYRLDRKMVWGNKSGIIATWSNDYFDFGHSYKSVWASQHFDLGQPSIKKYFRYFYVTVDNRDLFNNVMDTNIIIDHTSTHQSYDLSQTITRWGEFRWGDMILHNSISESLPFRINKVGRTIQFRFSNGYGVDDEVMYLVQLYRYPKKKKGIVLFVQEEESYYLYAPEAIDAIFDPKAGYGWIKLTDKDLGSQMKIHQLNCNYEMRRKV